MYATVVVCMHYAACPWGVTCHCVCQWNCNVWYVVGMLCATTIVCSDMPTCFAVYRGENVHACHCSCVCLDNAVYSGIVCVCNCHFI